MVSSLHEFDGIPSMVLLITSSISVEIPSRYGVSFDFDVYSCVPLKSFLMFCILLKKNATTFLASCWSDVDSGSGFCLFWLVISVIVLYRFLLSMLFVLTMLCIKLCFLYLSIVTSLFHSLLNAFQCWSSLYLIHFLSLFFMIFLCFF